MRYKKSQAVGSPGIILMIVWELRVFRFFQLFEQAVVGFRFLFFQ